MLNSRNEICKLIIAMFCYCFRYQLKNSFGTSVDIIDFGGIVTSINTPDRNGHTDDITTGFDRLSGVLLHFKFKSLPRE